MISTIKQFLQKRSEQYEALKIKEIEEFFSIAESGGFIYIMCNGVAVKKMDGFASTADVINSLNSCRECAVSFYKYKQENK